MLKIKISQQEQPEQPEPEASEDEIEKAILAYDDSQNTIQLIKLLQTKKIDPFYHTDLLEMFTDPKFFESTMKDKGRGPDPRTEIVPIATPEHIALYNLFLATQQPSSDLVNKYLHKTIYWYDPTSDRNVPTTFFEVLQN
jgi:hypothetical protein